MRFTKRLSSILLSCIMVVAACFGLVACKDTSGIDPNRTQLYVGFFEGGWGREWLDEMIKGFEEIYPEVQVIADGKKDEFIGSNLKNTVSSGKYDMYFTTASPYDFVAQETSQNLFLDITDAVTTPLTEYGENESIEDKMDPFMQEYMKASNNSGKYYSIPMYTSYYSVVYDVDLFEERSFYFAEGGGYTTGREGAKAKSVGQDGVAGTFDDGLPVTWDEFKTLLGRMKTQNIIPFTWNKDSGYRQDYFSTVWANYVGEENFLLNYTFDGVDTSQNNLEINETNGYELQKQPGKRAAIEMAKYIVENKLYDVDNADNSSFDYAQAQDTFLYSKYFADKGTGKRIAMLIEGGWWENEAKNTIEEMKQYGEGYQNRRFGIMTIPRFEGGSNQKVLYSVTGNSVVFIKSNAKQVEIAKNFLRYTTTDENLRLYNRMTGSTRAYDYELTQEDLEDMSYYKRSLWDIYNDENTGLVYSYGPSKLNLYNQSYFRNDWTWQASLPSIGVVSEPITAFMKHPTLTVDSYFSGLYTYHKDYWNNTLQK